MRLKINKGATVEVTTGSEKGRRGTVLQIDKEKMRIRIQGVKILTKHSKKDGLVKTEGFIHYSNVKLIDAPAPAKKKAVRKSTKEKSA